MDVNFFDEFKVNKTNRLKLISTIVFLLILLSLSLVAIENQIKILELNKEIEKRIDIIESPKSTSLVEEIKDLKLELGERQMEIDRLKRFESSLSQFSYLDSEILEDIYFKKNDGIVLSTFNCQENKIELNGFGANPNAVAEYSEILDESNNISEVRILSINLNEGYYSFLINLKLEGDTFER